MEGSKFQPLFQFSPKTISSVHSDSSDAKKKSVNPSNALCIDQQNRVDQETQVEREGHTDQQTQVEQGTQMDQQTQVDQPTQVDQQTQVNQEEEPR